MRIFLLSIVLIVNEISCIDAGVVDDTAIKPKVINESCTLNSVTDIATIKSTCGNGTVWLFIKKSHFHQFPRILDHFPNLETIDISYAGIEYIESTTFDKAGRLTNLNLQGNNMPKLQNNLFSHAENLTNLEFYNSSIETIEHHAFDGLSNLKKLDLSYNNIVHLDVEIFQPLSQLEQIRLTNNKIEIISDNTFERNVHLKWAYFSSNKINSVEPNAFKNCQLKTLDLANNQLTNLDVSTMKYLLTLIVSNNMLSTLNVPLTCEEVLAERNIITMIRSHDNNDLLKLFLSSNSLYNLENFPNFSKLTFLDLSNNYFQSINFFDLKNISQLTDLKLSGNKLAGIDSLDLVKNLPQLKRIELSTIHWPSAYIENLQNFLKGRNIDLGQDRSNISDDKAVATTPASKETSTASNSTSVIVTTILPSSVTETSTASIETTTIVTTISTSPVTETSTTLNQTTTNVTTISTSPIMETTSVTNTISTPNVTTETPNGGNNRKIQEMKEAMEINADKDSKKIEDKQNMTDKMKVSNTDSDTKNETALSSSTTYKTLFIILFVAVSIVVIYKVTVFSRRYFNGLSYRRAQSNYALFAEQDL